MAALAAATTFCSQAYDYVIAGGGSAGLVLAARLSENPKVSVAVIEAGEDRTDDPKVLVPGLGPSMLNDPTYDWGYKSVPQEHLYDRVIGMSRGKQLGGSSAINFLYFTHAGQEDINNWGKLGNDGWSWDSLFPYYLKSENSIKPTPQTAKDLEVTPQNYKPQYHGLGGPIQNSFPEDYTDWQKAWPRTYDTLGLGWDDDPKNGLALGGGTNLKVQGENRTRSYSATGYWKPASKRPNLKTLTGALVSRIVFDDKDSHKGKDIKATGVEFLSAGKTFTVNAKKEVILSAGTIGSPQILELSGIGGASLLESLNKKVLIDNPAVGENLQEHQLFPIGFEVVDGLPTNEDFADPKVFQAALDQYNKNHTGPFAGGICSQGLLSYPQVAASRPSHKVPKGINDPLLTREESEKYPGRAEQLEFTKKKLLDPKQACAQTLFFPGGINSQKSDKASTWTTATGPEKYANIIGVVTHPFSRGNIHITSADPAVYPKIDPRYMSHPLDVEVASTIAFHLQKLSRTPPLSNYLKGNATVYQPGFFEITEDNVESFIRNNTFTEWHPMGTCTMAPRHKGGVVNSRLKVYGTSNLRVVDASVFPLMVRANPVSLVYAVAEKVADIIKEDARKD